MISVIMIWPIGDGLVFVNVTEIVGQEGDRITMQDLFEYKQEGLDGEGKVLAHPLEDWVAAAEDLSYMAPVRRMMAGEKGAYCDAVCLNTAAALKVVGKTEPITIYEIIGSADAIDERQAPVRGAPAPAPPSAPTVRHRPPVSYCRIAFPLFFRDANCAAIPRLWSDSEYTEWGHRVHHRNNRYYSLCIHEYRS